MHRVYQLLIILALLLGCASTQPSNDALNQMSPQELNQLSVKLWKNESYTDPKLALKYANLATEKDPKYGRAYYTKGFAYYNLKQYELSIENFTKAIEIDPHIAESYNGRGWVYGTIDDYKKALKDFSKAIELDNNYALAYNNRGYTYLHLKDNIKACEDYKKACDLGDCRQYKYRKSIGTCN